MKNIIMTIMVGLFLIGTACSANAEVLLPGALNVAPTGAAAPTGTYVTSITDSFIGTDITGTVYYTGTLTETVLRDSTGLVFEYSFSNDSTSKDAITQLATLNYAGYYVSADALTSVNGMDRSSGQGDVVTFGWLDNPVDPGQSSGSFWIQTNASAYQAGSTQLIGAGIASTSTDGPAGLIPAANPLVTPEPATMSLLGMGLISLGGLRRKRSV
jgi:hypothetical protein